MKFHVRKWNKMDNEYVMLILTEEDIKNESDEYVGAGYEILIIPNKYKYVHSEYLDMVKIQVETRCGEIIYV